MRIDKLLSNLKYGSRKEIMALIKTGFVTVNDITINRENFQINPTIDIIKVQKELVYYKEEITLALNKPKGYVSANKDNLYPTVMELLESPYHRFDFKLAGRLDLNTMGLVILTTNGSLVHQITNPKFRVEKEYLIKTDRPIENYQRLLLGVNIIDGKKAQYFAKAIRIELLEENQLTMVINEGKFHQVKRMIEAIGYEVIELTRIRIGKLKLTDVKESFQEISAGDII